MVKVISGKRYDTSTAELLYYYSNGYSHRDFQFRKKRLYRTKNGNYFIYHEGGAMSDMARSCGSNNVCGGEEIEAVLPEDAYKFLERHSDESDAADAIEKYFADKVVDA